MLDGRGTFSRRRFIWRLTSASIRRRLRSAWTLRLAFGRDDTRFQLPKFVLEDKPALSSDRTSCRSALANQMRLILHTGAYWLLLDLRAAIPSWNPLKHTEFATIRLRLLKIASRFIETASRIRIALASCCPEAETFSLVALKLQPSGP